MLGAIDRIFQSDHSAPAGGRSVGQGAYLSTALAIRIVVREVGQAVVVVVVAAVVVVVGTFALSFAVVLASKATPAHRTGVARVTHAWRPRWRQVRGGFYAAGARKAPGSK